MEHSESRSALLNSGETGLKEEMSEITFLQKAGCQCDEAKEKKQVQLLCSS